MKTLAESAGQSLNVFMNDRVSDALVWADLRPIKEAIDVAEVREDASQMLRETVKLYGAYECIFLLDTKGNCIASSAPALVGIDFSGNDAFKGAKGGKLFVTDFQKSPVVEQLDPTSGGWTLGISAPVKVGENVQGAILAYLKWAPVEKIISDIKIGESGYVWVVSNNKPIIHPSRDLYPEDVSGPKINLPQLTEALKKKDRDIVYQFTNVKTKKLDDKVIGLAYPGGLGQFRRVGMGIGSRRGQE